MKKIFTLIAVLALSSFANPSDSVTVSEVKVSPRASLDRAKAMLALGAAALQDLNQNVTEELHPYTVAYKDEATGESFKVTVEPTKVPETERTATAMLQGTK
jgi:hypothetical protein